MKMNLRLTADELVDVVDAAVGEAMDRGYDGLDVDELTDDMCHIVDAALSAMGIEIVEDTDTEDEDEDEEEVDDFGVPMDYDSDFDEDEDDEEEVFDYDEYFTSMIYDLNGHRVISWDDACETLANMCKLVAEYFPELEGEAVYNKAVEIFLHWSEHYNIEGVDVSE